MNKHDARAAGYREGYAAACNCEVTNFDKKEAGCDCEQPVINSINYKPCRECLSYAAFEAEMTARDFSPWEFIAAEINGSGDRSEGLWEAYDNGVAAGIKKGVRERLRLVA